MRSPDVAFIVMLAGSGLTGEEIIALQGELIAKAAGAPALSLAINRILQKKLVEMIKRETDNAAAGTKLDDFLKELWPKPAGESSDSPNALEQTIRAQWKQMTTPWFRHFLTYDPRPALEKVRCPVLALNGELDLQVPPKNNLPVIEAALKAG